MWKEERGEAAGEGEEVRADMSSGRRGGGRCIRRRAVANPSPA